MSKSINHKLSFMLLLLVLVLSPAPCLALSIANSPRDVGNGFFLYVPDHGENWQIFFEDKTQYKICYDTGWQDAFVTSVPKCDYDEHWVYVKTDIYEPKHVEPPQSERTKRLVYFLFN